MDTLHFLRADWFYAFIPLFLFLLLLYKRKTSNKNWTGIIDPQLAPFVLSQSVNKRRRYPLLLIFIAASLCITALAGPVYEKLPQPVYREQSSLVVLLDLSQSMNAADIKPSRLSRAKLELLDLLESRKEGQTALIVYAAEAFVVTPLTDDNATIANLVPALETQMMPAQGSNLSAALAKAFSLFSQSGIIRGDILVITDGIHQREETAIKKVTSQGHRLSIFGIGTRQGAPIPLLKSTRAESTGGGFLLNSNGAIVVPKLQPAKLQRYALHGAGLYISLQADDSDTHTLNNLFQSSKITTDSIKQNLQADVWREEGHWLLLPLLFFAALWARKGWLAVVLIIILPLPEIAHAESTQPESLIDSKHLWSSPDQKAMRAFNTGDYENAAKQFNHRQWKANAYYRKGDYQAAVSAFEEALQNNASSTGYYNKANALARLGKFQEAINAYDKALELDESHSDAIHNREKVKQALQKQQENNQQNNDKKQGDEQQDGEQQDKQQEQNSEKQQQNSDKNSPSQQESTAEDSSQQEADPQQQDEQSDQQKPGSKSEQQKQAEDEQLKQRDAEAEEKKQQAEREEYEQQQKTNDETGVDKLENKAEENAIAEDQPLEIEVNPTEASITEDEKATAQWLKRIPDDPGGLLRRKFYYQHKNNPDQSDDNEPW